MAESTEGTVSKMRGRATAARKFAMFSIGLIIAVVWIMMFFFFVSPSAGIQLTGKFESVTIQQGLLTEIAPAIAKLTTIVLAVFLIQILVGFTRYQFRIADHLDAAAFALEVSGGDAEKLSKVMSVLNPSHIEFGKLPTTLSEKGLEVIKDAIAKIPTK